MNLFKQTISSKNWQTALQQLSQMPLKNTRSRIRGEFLIYRQWYFAALLDKDSTQVAIQILQNELKPRSLAKSSEDSIELAKLSNLLVFQDKHELLCQMNEIVFSNKQGKKKGTTTEELEKMYLELNPLQIARDVWGLLKFKKNVNGLLPPPPNRLEAIVKQAKSLQVLKCPFHDEKFDNTSIVDSHCCLPKRFPNSLASSEKQHDDEVWHVQFSPNGRFAVSICKQSRIVLWKISSGNNPKRKECQKSQKCSRSIKSSIGISEGSNQESFGAYKEENHMLISDSQRKVLNKDTKDSSLESGVADISCVGGSGIGVKRAKKVNQGRFIVGGNSKSTCTTTNGKKKRSQEGKGSVKLVFVSKVECNKNGKVDESHVQCFAWNETSSHFVTCESNKRIRVWSIAKDTTGTMKVEAAIEEGEVEAKCVTFVGEKILFTAEDEFIYIWQWRIGRGGGGGGLGNNFHRVPKMKCEYDNQSIHHYTKAVGKENIVAVSNSGRVSTINLENRQEMSYFVEKDPIVSATLAQDSNYMLLNTIRDECYELHLWNMESNSLSNAFKGFEQTDCQLRSSFSDPYLAIGDELGFIQIWHKNVNQYPVCRISVGEKAGVAIEQSHGCVGLKMMHTEYSGSRTVGQVHFNPVYKGMLICACDDMTIRLFTASDCVYQIESESEQPKKNTSRFESIKKVVSSFIPYFKWKNNSEKKEEQNLIQLSEDYSEQNSLVEDSGSEEVERHLKEDSPSKQPLLHVLSEQSLSSHRISRQKSSDLHAQLYKNQGNSSHESQEIEQEQRDINDELIQH